MREENVIFTLLSRTLNRTAMYGPRLAMSFCVPNCRSIIFVFARTIAGEVVGLLDRRRLTSNAIHRTTLWDVPNNIIATKTHYALKITRYSGTIPRTKTSEVK